MSKLIFKPVSIVAGLLSGLIGKRLFDLVWRLVDKQEPPRAEYRSISVPKLTLALLIEGAIFRTVKGLVDHGSREGFAHVTGSWPGEEEPQDASSAE
jgi:xanthosine utilization system XapX-like protein